jgi:hypothetical protein
MTEPHKVCPLAAAYPQQKNSDCLGEACACYVKMHKHLTMQTERGELSDTEFFYRYKGCGLVAQVPWELIRSEENPHTTKPKPVN